MTDDKVTKEDIELAVQDLRDRFSDLEEAGKVFSEKQQEAQKAFFEVARLKEEYDRQHD